MGGMKYFERSLVLFVREREWNFSESRTEFLVGYSAHHDTSVCEDKIGDSPNAQGTSALVLGIRCGRISKGYHAERDILQVHRLDLLSFNRQKHRCTVQALHGNVDLL